MKCAARQDTGIDRRCRRAQYIKVGYYVAKEWRRAYGLPGIFKAHSMVTSGRAQ